MFDALKHVAEQSENPQILEHRLRKSTFRFMCVCVEPFQEDTEPVSENLFSRTIRQQGHVPYSLHIH